MRLIPLFIAVALGFVAFYFIYFFFSSETPTVQEKQVIVEKPVEVIRPEPTKQILIASRYIAPGSIIDSTMLERQDWPERLIVDQFLVSGSPQANIIGMVARSPFQPREPLALSKLAKQGDPSFIAANLPTGQRMVTIATDGINGVAGFIFPGDKVDVLLTHNVEIPNSDANARNGNNRTQQEQITEPLLVGVNVIAVDQRAGSEAAEKAQLPSSVSLQVTPEDAQKLRLAEKRGSLSLALRGLKDKDQSLAAPTTRYGITHFYTPGEESESQVAFAGNAAMPNQARPTITVTRGVKSEMIEVQTPETSKPVSASPKKVNAPAAEVPPAPTSAPAQPEPANVPVVPQINPSKDSAPAAPVAPQAQAAPAPVEAPLAPAPQPMPEKEGAISAMPAPVVAEDSAVAANSNAMPALPELPSEPLSAASSTQPQPASEEMPPLPQP